MITLDKIKNGNVRNLVVESITGKMRKNILRWFERVKKETLMT